MSSSDDASRNPRDALHDQARQAIGRDDQSGRKRRVLENVLEARQFALKMIANVTYGYRSLLRPNAMLELADAIVKAGRMTLEHEGARGERNGAVVGSSRRVRRH